MLLFCLTTADCASAVSMLSGKYNLHSCPSVISVFCLLNNLPISTLNTLKICFPFQLFIVSSNRNDLHIQHRVGNIVGNIVGNTVGNIAFHALSASVDISE